MIQTGASAALPVLLRALIQPKAYCCSMLGEQAHTQSKDTQVSYLIDPWGNSRYIYMYQHQCKMLLHSVGGIQRPPAATAGKGAGKNPQRSNALHASLNCLNCITEAVWDVWKLYHLMSLLFCTDWIGSIKMNLLTFIINFYKTAISSTLHWFLLCH